MAVIEEQTTGSQHVISFADSTLGVQEDPHQTTRDEQVCRSSARKPTGHSIGPHLESCKVLDDKHLGSGTLRIVRSADQRSDFRGKEIKPGVNLQLPRPVEIGHQTQSVKELSSAG